MSFAAALALVAFLAIWSAVQAYVARAARRDLDDRFRAMWRAIEAQREGGNQ